MPIVRPQHANARHHGRAPELGDQKQGFDRGRALVGNVAERSLVGSLGGLIRLLLLWRLILGFFPLFGHRLFLRVGRPGQHHNHRRGADNSHANTP